MLLAAADPVGDYNHDGSVDAADYVAWRKSGGSLDGYNTWRAHFGAAAGSGAALHSADSPSAPVPEPTSLALCVLGLFAMERHRNCRPSPVPKHS